jgi:hypothetical protein
MSTVDRREYEDAKAKYASTVEVVVVNTEDVSRAQWSDNYLKESVAARRKVLPEFVAAHNRNVAMMQSLLDEYRDNEFVPKYPAMPKRVYAARLTSDSMLQKALKLRMEMEEKVLVLRTRARLALQGINMIDPPYWESPHLIAEFKKKQRFPRIDVTSTCWQQDSKYYFNPDVHKYMNKETGAVEAHSVSDIELTYVEMTNVSEENSVRK